MSSWHRLHDELDHWQDTGLDLSIWLRDDDAVEPTPRLEQLLGLSRRFRIPVLLAVIPALAGEPLAARLSGEPLMLPCQHGWRHTNHAPKGEKSAEFGHHRPLDALLADVEAGLQRFLTLFPWRSGNIFVPPWNRISPQLVQGLPDFGFNRLSAFRLLAQSDFPGLRVINPDIDIIDWKAGRVLRPASEIEHDIVTRLVELRIARQERPSLGLLLHHLVQEPDAWALLDSLMTALARWSHVRFVNPEQI
jgi:hypothetical protein